MKKLRELRKARNMTMKELGEILNLSESTISLYETGKTEPEYNTLIQLSKIFNVSIDYLLENSKEEPPKANTVTLVGVGGKVEKVEFTDEEIQAFKTLFKDKFNNKK